MIDTGQRREPDHAYAHAIVMVGLRDQGLRELSADPELCGTARLGDDGPPATRWMSWQPRLQLDNPAGRVVPLMHGQAKLVPNGSPWLKGRCTVKMLDHPRPAARPGGLPAGTPS